MVSDELGADAKIFDIALQRLGGLSPDEVIFLDDREPNMVAARELGLHAIHVRNHAQAYKDVRAVVEADSIARM